MSPRPRAYETLQVPFRFIDLPLEIKRNGVSLPNPVRQTAVFVVHGIGLQQYPATAVTLRVGFEDAIDEIGRAYPEVAVPPPFIYEGYWADYAVFEKTFPLEWKQSNPREQAFFNQLWQRRSVSAWGTARWFIRENLRLFHLRTLRDAGRLRGITLMAAAPLTFLAAILMLLRHPKVLADVLGDVRIYCDPRGDVEMAITHRVDYRVGAAFLSLLGLDWNFQVLPEQEQLEISGTRHRFSYITWIAHSLGTVISYNVIGDILHRAATLKQELEDRAQGRGARDPEPEQDRQLRENIERVEKGLHRFVTFGSPLEQINTLFPEVFHAWPAGSARQYGLKAAPRDWWVNFYHVLDPISSRLLSSRFADFVSNRHGKLLRVPGIAHISYWYDTSILKYLVSRAYGPDLCPWPEPKFLSERFSNILRHVIGWLTLTGILIAVFLLAQWAVSGGGFATIWRLLKLRLTGLP